MLKVDDPDSFRIDEEVILPDIRVIDSAMVPERGQNPFSGKPMLSQSVALRHL